MLELQVMDETIFYLFSLFSMVGYNLSHAIFTSTTSLIQTTLIVSDVGILVPGKTQSYTPLLTLADPRIRPAFYLIFISLLTFLTLTVGVSLCEEKRIKRKQNDASFNDSLQDSNPLNDSHSRTMLVKCREITDEKCVDGVPTAPIFSAD